MHIQEMARRLQTTPRAIRFYEQKGLIRPAKKAANGYRAFTEEDAWRLQTILALREVGMPIEEIRKVLEKLDQEEESLLHYLELQRAYMYDRWIELKNAIQTTESMIERIRQSKMLDPGALYQLADTSRSLRKARKEWVDRWNFNQLAAVYDEWVTRETSSGFQPHRGYDEVLSRVVEAIAPKPGETGLDIGTGTGNLTARLLPYQVNMCAVDQSNEMLKRCRAKNPGVETKVGTFFAIPYMDQTFDFVVTSYALHHLTDEQKCLALAEFCRVLKPGGRLAIADFMFVDQQHRTQHLDQLVQNGETEAWQQITDAYYADRSVLCREMERLGFRCHAVQLNPYVHLLTGTCS